MSSYVQVLTVLICLIFYLEVRADQDVGGATWKPVSKSDLTWDVNDVRQWDRDGLSNVARSERIGYGIRSLGFELTYSTSCADGVLGWFQNKTPSGKPGITVCSNQHETSGAMATTLAHEISHAAQFCANGRVIHDTHWAYDLITNADKLEIIELYTPEDRELEVEARGFHVLGRFEALEVLRENCVED